uniref:Wsv021-like protein n=1 Tax=Trachysalambria curvirostris nimavirus TaxID=2984282 RepID=A0A9C7BMY7_9VIRU|nr:MAG: wsv021-like protein [Trachysalambria curvirostris nimavirus]
MMETYKPPTYVTYARRLWDRLASSASLIYWPVKTTYFKAGIKIWDRLVSFARNVDWPIALGVFYLISMIGLTVAIYLRCAARERLLVRPSGSHFTSRYLPVAYLSSASGKVEDMFLSADQFVVFSILNDKISKRRHAMCTDQLSWFQFCHLAAAEVYQRISSPVSEGQFNSGRDDHGGLLLDRVIDSSIQDLVKPYIRYIFMSKTNVPPHVLDASMSLADTRARGVPDIGPIGDISAANISIASV